MTIADSSTVTAGRPDPAGDPASRPASLARNTVAQSAPLFLSYALSFLSAPILLAGLGLHSFGIWALTGALAQYGALLDLGTGFSLCRYLTAHQDDRRLCGAYMAIGWLSVLGVGAVLTPAALLAAAPLAHSLHGISVAEMRTVLVCSVVLLLCSMTGGVVSAHPLGRRRMVAPNVGLALGSLINFAASVTVLELGTDLAGYAVANAAAALTGVGLTAALVVRAEGAPPLARPHVALARDFLRFSIGSQLVRVMDLVNYQTDKIIIAFSIGATAAGAYDLANRVAMAVRQVGIYVTSAMDLELTAVGARLGIDGVRPRYGRFTAYSATFGFPPVLLTMATAPLLLRAWLSHVPADTELVLVALCGAYLIATSTSVGFGVAIAMGRPGIVARTATATAVANLMLTAGLAPVFGLWGILAGTVVALTAGALVQVVAVHRRYAIPASAYIRAVAPPLRAYALLAVPVAAVAYAGLAHTRVVAAALLVLLCAAYSAACALYAARAGRLPGRLVAAVPRLARVARAV